MIIAHLVLSGAVYALIGTFAGLMAGILGIGGGVVVVPGLLFVFQKTQVISPELSMQVAAGSSLAVMIVTAQSSIRAHIKIGVVLWPVFRKLAPGIFLGTIVGALVATVIPTYLLKMIFAFFLLLVALKMATDLHVSHAKRSPPTWVYRLVSLLIGFKSGLLGVGGGILVVPFLTYCGVAVRQIAVLSNLCSLTVAVVGTFVFMISDHHLMDGVPYSTGYIYWPAVFWVALFSSLSAPFGAKLNYIIPIKQLKFGFIIILLITAFSMFF